MRLFKRKALDIDLEDLNSTLSRDIDQLWEAIMSQPPYHRYQDRPIDERLKALEAAVEELEKKRR